MAKHRRTPQAQALRLGLLIDGQIREQRIIEDDGDVTLGEGEGFSLHVPGARGQAPLRLFTLKKGRVALVCPPGIEGRISRGGRLEPLAPAAEAMGAALPRPLNLGDRGKLSLGEGTILFQIVPRQLAPGERRGIPLLWRFDTVMARVLALSLLCHLSFVFYVQAMEPPPKPTWEDLESTFPQRTVILRPPPKEAPPEPQIASRPKVRPETPSTPDIQSVPGAEKEDKETVRARIRERFDIFGSRGKDGRGQVRADVEALLLNETPEMTAFLERGRPITTGGAGGMKAGIGPEIVDVRDGPRIGTTDVEVTRKVAALPTLEESSLKPPPTLDQPERLKQALAVYAGAIASCHTQALNQDPRVDGRVVMAVSVSPEGEVLSVDLMEDSAGSAVLTGCMRTRMRRWRLPTSSAAYTLNLPYIFTAPQ